MQIRAATLDDVESIAGFYEDIRRDTVPIVHSVEDVASWIATQRVPRGSSFVAEIAGQVVGWLDVHGDDLDQLYVKRGFTGQGIGLTLLSFAKERSPGRLTLFTFQVNEGARRFYRREGFVEVRFGDGTQNEEGRPDVMMEWRAEK